MSLFFCDFPFLADRSFSSDITPDLPRNLPIPRMHPVSIPELTSKTLFARRVLGFLAGSVAVFLGSGQAPINFCLQIMAKIFRKNSWRDHFAEIGNGQFRQERQNGGQSGSWLAKQRDAHVVHVAP